MQLPNAKFSWRIEIYSEQPTFQFGSRIFAVQYCFDPLKRRESVAMINRLIIFNVRHYLQLIENSKKKIQRPSLSSSSSRKDEFSSLLENDSSEEDCRTTRRFDAGFGLVVGKLL